MINRQFMLMLYIDIRPGKTCHSKVMHRKEVTHSNGSYEKKSHRLAFLTIWDKVKSHGTLIDWCTGREWPVNCMAVISAWWRSNMPFQRLSRRLNYFFFHHTTCGSTCDTLASSAAIQGDNTVSVAQGGTATPGATEQLLPPDRVF